MLAGERYVLFVRLLVSLLFSLYSVSSHEKQCQLERIFRMQSCHLSSAELNEYRQRVKRFCKMKENLDTCNFWQYWTEFE